MKIETFGKRICRLLTPLARALHTDLNTLFSYEEILSPEKVKHLADKAEEIAGTEGTDAGIRYLNACLQEYPNSERLMLAWYFGEPGGNPGRVVPSDAKSRVYETDLQEW